MKKIIASAVGLVLVGGFAATNASAFESQFGGYWRTRAWAQDNFGNVNITAPDGTIIGHTNDTSGQDYIDNRTRLYYTAVFSDDFKFVNKFEFNTTWGDTVGGDIGADGTGIFRIKNSYADWNMGAVNAKLGIQAAVISRGFIFDDDFSGAVLTPKFGNVTLPLAYIAVADDDAGADTNADMFATMPTIKISDAASVTPFFVYFDQGEAHATKITESYALSPVGDVVESYSIKNTTYYDTQAYYIGVDADVTLDPVSIWGTFIYNGGTKSETVDGMDMEYDINGFLVAGGVDAGIAHGQAFYASGDDNPSDTDANNFHSAPGASYYWSEILGYGIFDFYAPNAAPTNKISNVIAANGGVTIKPMDKLTIKGDVWYAMLAEENAYGEDELGWEFDGVVTYSIFDNLSADFVLAYLVAGDAVGPEDVMEGGVRVSLKF